MIERTQAFKVGDKTFGTLEEAQTFELAALMSTLDRSASVEDKTIQDLAAGLVENQAQAIDILTTTPTSKPKARKVHGGTKKRPGKQELPNSAQ